MNRGGESRHRHVRAKNGKEGKRESNKDGQEGEREGAWGRGCGGSESKKKSFWVESEETQDYVRESLNLSREEAEEISFVPSALGIPRGPLFWCAIALVTKPSDSGSLLR